MKAFFSIFAFLVLAGIPALVAQQPPNPANPETSDARRPATPPNISIWKAELPGGSYAVARNSISAISVQQYLLDGAARVTEVNISTSGNFQPRFYYLEPLPPSGVVQSVPGAEVAADRVQTTGQSAVSRVAPGGPIWTKVIKNYPATTHAGTIEFRLETREQLDELYESVERTWITGKSEVYTPAGAAPYHSKKKSEDGGDDEQDAGSSDASPDPGTPN